MTRKKQRRKENKKSWAVGKTPSRRKTEAFRVRDVAGRQQEVRKAGRFGRVYFKKHSCKSERENVGPA